MARRRRPLSLARHARELDTLESRIAQLEAERGTTHGWPSARPAPPTDEDERASKAMSDDELRVCREQGVSPAAYVRVRAELRARGDIT